MSRHTLWGFSNGSRSDQIEMSNLVSDQSVLASHFRKWKSNQQINLPFDTKAWPPTVILKTYFKTQYGIANKRMAPTPESMFRLKIQKRPNISEVCVHLDGLYYSCLCSLVSSSLIFKHCCSMKSVIFGEGPVRNQLLTGA